jgi:formiminotetrahydrofolate cyclodeaminase
MYDSQSTIDAFLDAAAAKQPAPGGGSVTALAGALAASMGEMVVNYSVGKKSLQQFDPELRAALGEFARARQMLLMLMEEDQAAFSALSDARKLPEGSSERGHQFPAALLACIRVPQTIGATAAAVLDLANRLADQVNFYLLSDLAVCADLSMAAVRCAVYNVRVNLPDVTDPAERAAIEADGQRLLARGLKLIQEISPRIWARHAAGK